MSKLNVKYMLGLTVAGMMLVGCDRREATPVVPPTAPPAPQTQTPTLPQIDTTAAQNAIDDAKSDVNNAASDAKATANAMSAETEAIANDMIAKVQTFIKENKLDDADSTLKKLEEMKDKLPQNLQDQVAKLRPMLDSAKNMKMPSMPAMGK